MSNANGKSTRAFEGYVGALDAQLRRLEVIQRLQEAQREAIDSEDGEALVAIMEARERVIDEIRAGETACDAAQAAWNAAGASGGTEAARARAAADAVRERADAIVARDASDEQELLMRSERLREELGELGRTRGALGAYAPRGVGEAPAYQDRSA